MKKLEAYKWYALDMGTRSYQISSYLVLRDETCWKNILKGLFCYKSFIRSLNDFCVNYARYLGMCPNPNSQSQLNRPLVVFRKNKWSVQPFQAIHSAWAFDAQWRARAPSSLILSSTSTCSSTYTLVLVNVHKSSYYECYIYLKYVFQWYSISDYDVHRLEKLRDWA